MHKHNFSTEQSQVYDLALDLMRGDFSTEGGVTKKDLEQHLRDTINHDILQGKTMYQAMRRNNIALFEIIEEIVNTTIGEEILESPFIDQFVEVKNRAFGDNTEFYSEGGILVASSFAGNHWDTNRQSLDLGEAYTLGKEWVYIHVYDELERFLQGASSMEKLTTKMYQAINRFMKERLYAMFHGVTGSVPAELTKSGNDAESFSALCDLVQTYGGYSSLTIAGTRAAIRKLAGTVPENLFAESQREAIAKTGVIAEWEGNKLMEIPQVLKPGTFEFALDNDQLFILGGDVKPIKMEFVGDTRTDMDTTGKKYNDMTFDAQVQTCVGFGMVMPDAFGHWTFV